MGRDPKFPPGWWVIPGIFCGLLFWLTVFGIIPWWFALLVVYCGLLAVSLLNFLRLL